MHCGNFDGEKLMTPLVSMEISPTVVFIYLASIENPLQPVWPKGTKSTGLMMEFGPNPLQSLPKKHQEEEMPK